MSADLALVDTNVLVYALFRRLPNMPPRGRFSIGPRSRTPDSASV
jgi:hypothetical protein